MRNTLFSPIAAAAFGLALTASAASAQDVIVYDAYDDYPPPYEIVEVPPPPPAAVVEVPGPGPTRVYGWVAARPASCGEYHYWDGARCLDAREDPPDTGPRW